MTISMIVAFGKNWQIGLDNKLLWHISEDLKNFKSLTSGHHIIMGRKTFESIGKPLPNRTSIVLSKSNFIYDGIEIFSEIEDALKFCEKNGENEVFIIGGAQIYEIALNFVDKLYLTEVDYDKEADAFLKAIDFKKWNLESQIKHTEIKENSIIKTPAWNFKIYTKSLY